MSSRTITPVNGKINTIQPIEGTKGNIARYYYQGKYPIYKSLDDNMYHLKSVMVAYKDSTDRDISKNLINDWIKLKKTQELVSYFFETGIPVSKVLVRKQQQKPQNRHLDGWYANEEAMLDFAGWLNVGFRVDLYRCFARQAEIDRLNADINHKQSTIDKLQADIQEVLKQNKETHQKLDNTQMELSKTRHKLDETHKQLTDANHKLDTIKADMKSIAPVASGLTNRISSPLSEEYLLINYTENDNGTVNVTYNAVNPTTIKRQGLNVDDSWLHQRFANSVDAQNRLLELIEQDRLNIGRIDRRAKSFVMNIVDMERLTTLVTVTLPDILNKESMHIKNKANKAKETQPKPPAEAEYMGYPLKYCKSVCKRYSISMETLTDIINKEYRYGSKDYPMRLHPTEGIVYGKSVNGKTRWYKISVDTFTDD